MKVALLTNEMPPIVYGGVATWILNFMEMFQGDPDIEIIPVFLAQLDEPPDDFPERYPGIRIIHGPEDIPKALILSIIRGVPLVDKAVLMRSLSSSVTIPSIP